MNPADNLGQTAQLAAAGLGFLVSLALSLALLVVALGPVRKASAGAGGLLATTAGLQLLTLIVCRVGYSAVTFVNAEVEVIRVRMAALSAAGTVVDALLTGMLIASIAMLARSQTPGRDVRDADVR